MFITLTKNITINILTPKQLEQKNVLEARCTI